MRAPLTANGLFRKSKTGSALSGVAFGRRPGRLDQYRQALRQRHRIEGAHVRASIVPGREPAGQRAERDEQEPHRLTGGFAAIAEFDRIAEHVPVRGQMRAHIGLAQDMLPFQRPPRGGFIAESS